MKFNWFAAIFAAIIVIAILSASGCASLAQSAPATESTPVEIVAPAPVQSVTGHTVFDEANRCQGVVKYQVEEQDGRIRSRLTCEWEVEPDDWAAWQ